MLHENYEKPVVTDYGSLSRLTADFDVTFAGTIAKSVVLAAVSSPLTGVMPGGDAGPEMPSNMPTGGDILGDGDSSPTGDAPGTDEGGGNSPAGDTLGDERSGSAGPEGDSAVDPVANTSDGKLAFTGYAAGAMAAAGAIATGTGIAVRAALRRR